jgi:hypothetical protein
MYGTCSTESRKIKREGRKGAIATVSADGRWGSDPNKTTAKNYGLLPVYALYTVWIKSSRY